jgi:hypothetical protein
MYKTFEEVKLENKFAPFPIRLPVESEPRKALIAVKQVTRHLKQSFAQIYSIYVLGIVLNTLCPAFLATAVVANSSTPFTLVFSNVPGVLKPVHFGPSKNLGFHSYVTTSGRVPICFSMITYAEGFRLTCTADTAVMNNDEVHEVITYMEEALDSYTKLAKEQVEGKKEQ